MRNHSAVKVHQGLVADGFKSDLQVSHREVWERRSNSKIVALRTETRYKGVIGGTPKWIAHKVANRGNITNLWQ